MKLSYADIAATIALIISLLAIYQSASHRTRDMKVKARTDLDRIKEGLLGVSERIHEVKVQWQSALAASGMLGSGAAQLKFEEIEQLCSRVDQLSTEVRSITVPTLPIVASLKIDDCATRVGNADHRWSQLDSQINAMLQDAKDNREKSRRR